MAERRMFHRLVVESDKFLDLSIGAQVLYFHLGMQADDDGFINGPKLIARQLKRPYKDLQALIDAGFLLAFDDVVVLTHWRVANTLQNDRIRLPQYADIAKKLFVNEEKLYTKIRRKGCKSLYSYKKKRMKQVGIRLDSQQNITKENLKEEKRNKQERNQTKERAEEALPWEEGEDCAPAPENDSVLEFMNGKLGKGVVLLTQGQMTDLLAQMGLDSFDYYVERLADYILKNQCKIRNHYETILRWWNEDRSVK